MGVLADNIRKAVREGRYVFGDHADERLTTRGIMGWQVVAGLENARLLLEREDGIPHPVVEFEEVLVDGTPIKAVWAWISEKRIAKLVTVHLFPRMGPWN